MSTKKSINEDSYRYAAIFFFIMMIIVIIRNLIVYDFYNSVWFCDISILLLFIAFLTENVQFIKGLINIGLIAQFIFVLDFVLYFFFGISLSGLSSNLIETGPINVIFSLILHIFSINLALFLTYRKKTKPVSLLYSFLVLVLLFVLTILLTPKSENINYVFSSSFLLGLTVPHYVLLWIPLAFLILVLPTYWFQGLLYNLSRRKH